MNIIVLHQQLCGKGLPATAALTIQHYCILTLYGVGKIGSKPYLLPRYNAVAHLLNCSTRLGKLVARPICSHNTTLLHTQLLYGVGKIGGKTYLLLWYNAIAHSIAL